MSERGAKPKASARVTIASMMEHAVACLVEEHAVWTKRGLEQGKGEVNRIEKGVFVKNAAMNAELTGMIASEPYKMGSTLLQAGVSYDTYKTNKALAEKGLK